MGDVKAVVFDLYGTLIRIADESRPYARLFRELNLGISESRLAKKVALTYDFDFATLAERVRPDAKVDLRSYEEEISRELRSAVPYPETMRVLGELKSRGVSTCVISNLASPYRTPFFSTGISGFIDRCFFSCIVGLKKPSPEIYRMAISSMGLEPRDALMVGDSAICDVYGPKFIGMNAVLLARDGRGRYPVKIRSLDEVLKYC